MSDDRDRAGNGGSTEQAVESPPPPSALPELLALYRAGRLEEAMATCRAALAGVSPEPALLALAGRIAADLGHSEEALSFYDAAIAARPKIAELHYSRGNALARLGRNEAAVEAYQTAAAYRPDLAPIHNNLGVALQALGRWAEAVAAYQEALALAPGTAGELYRNLGIALEGAGRRAEAIAAFRQGLALKPDWPALYQNLATALLEAGDARATVEACDAWLRLEPGVLEAIGLKAVALDELGDRAGARYLVDFDRFLRIVQLEKPPAGFRSLRQFNEALSQEVLAHPSLAVPDASEAHYNGPGFRTTGELFGPTTGPWAALQKLFSDAVRDYLGKEARPDPDHPYLARPPRHWQPSAVGTVLDRLGALAPHVHYDGYVSGVYYCRLPESIGAPGQGRAGWFEIGRLQKRFHQQGKPEIRAIQPREGMMILFPSYFFHNTVPFAAGETRISIAFDAIPVAAGPSGRDRR